MVGTSSGGSHDRDTGCFVWAATWRDVVGFFGTFTHLSRDSSAFFLLLDATLNRVLLGTVVSECAMCVSRVSAVGRWGGVYECRTAMGWSGLEWGGGGRARGCGEFQVSAASP